MYIKTPTNYSQPIKGYYSGSFYVIDDKEELKGLSENEQIHILEKNFNINENWNKFEVTYNEKENHYYVYYSSDSSD